MANFVNGAGMPMGLGMALAEDLDAMNYFSSLSPEQQHRVMEHTHDIHSKEEMQAYVRGRFQGAL